MDLRGRSLVWRLRALVGAVVLISCLAIGWLGYSTAESGARKDAAQWLGDAVAAYGSLLDEFLKDSQDAVRSIARNAVIREGMEARAAGRISAAQLQERCRSILLDRVNDTACVLALVLTDRNGIVMASSDDRSLGGNFASHPDFREGLSGEYVSEPIQSGEKYQSFASGPLRSARGEVLGVVVATFDWTSLMRMITSPQRMGSTGEVMVASRRGDAVNILVPVGANETVPIPLEAGSVAGRAVLGERGFVQAVDHRGREVLAAFCPAGKSHIGLVVKIDTEEAFGNVRRLRWVLAGSTLALVLLALAATQVLATRLTNPILVLTRQAALIAEGDLGARAQVSDAGEIGTLARHFNVMAENLAASHATLEQKVEERTRELARAHHLLASVLNCMGDAVVVVGHDGELLVDNPEARRILGVDAGAGRRADWGSRWGARLPDQVTPCPAEAFPLARALAGQIVAPAEMYFVNECVPEGLWVSIVARPLPGEGGAAPGAVLVMHDVSSQKAAAEAIRRSEEKLRIGAKMEAVGTLAAGIAHHFSNLVQVIVGHAEAFERVIPPDHANRRDLDTISETADRISALVRRLLRYARRDPPVTRHVDLNAATREAEELLRSFLPRSIRLHMSASPSAAGIRIDPRELEEVLVNLVINARDAMAGGGTLTIGVSVEESPGGDAPVVLRVTDTGCGMDPGTLHHIFEPFYTTKGPDRGTGLGLALVYGIVQRSGGTVGAESRVGEGTSITLRFPASLPEAPVAAALLPDRPALEEPHRQGGSETILVVTEHRQLREVLVQRLSDHGFTALEAATYEEASELAQEWEEPVDLMILDSDVTPGERPAPVGSRPPAVLRLAGAREESPASAPDDPAVLDKPFRIATLVTRIRALLDSRDPRPAP